MPTLEQSERLRTLADQIERFPERFDMDNWATVPNEDDDDWDDRLGLNIEGIFDNLREVHEDGRVRFFLGGIDVDNCTVHACIAGRAALLWPKELQTHAAEVHAQQGAWRWPGEDAEVTVETVASFLGVKDALFATGSWPTMWNDDFYAQGDGEGRAEVTAQFLRAIADGFQPGMELDSDDGG